MRKFDLQLFTDSFTAVRGNKLIYLFRRYADRATATGAVIAYTKENTRSTSSNADTVETKDGTVRLPKDPDSTVNVSCYLKKNDEMIPKLDRAVKKCDLMEVWEVNLEEPGASEGKFKATYWQGYATSIEKSSPADDYVEVSLTFTLNGEGEEGDETVTEEQQAEATYVFADTTATGVTGATGTTN